MRYSASEKYEIIRLVEGACLSVRKTLRQLDIHKSTFYNWLKRYQEHGMAVWKIANQARRLPGIKFLKNTEMRSSNGHWKSLPYRRERSRWATPMIRPILSPNRLYTGC